MPGFRILFPWPFWDYYLLSLKSLVQIGPYRNFGQLFILEYVGHTMP
jgi:hypothetical protein